VSSDSVTIDTLGQLEAGPSTRLLCMPVIREYMWWITEDVTVRSVYSRPAIHLILTRTDHVNCIEANGLCYVCYLHCRFHCGICLVNCVVHVSYGCLYWAHSFSDVFVANMYDICSCF